MAIEIDQSGKIEETAKDTVIASLSDGGERFAVLIPKKIKRQVQEVFRCCGASRLFVYFLFSFGLFVLVSNVKRAQRITVDIEYPGKEKLVKGLVFTFFRLAGKKFLDFEFSRIGNHPKVHYAAKDVFDKKMKANRIVTLREVLQATKMADGHLRECLSTLVDARPRP